MTKPSSVDQGVHAYKCPGQGDLRSVCPALNTMANHSYIPHDGRHITCSTLIHALRDAYGISIGFATFLAFGSYALLRHNPLEPLNLHEISHRGRIEHKSSVVHDDANSEEYAPTGVDVELLHKFLTKAYSPATLRVSEGEDIIGIEDFAYTRIARQAASGPIDGLHGEIARGEFAMVFNIFGDGAKKTLNKEDIEVWLKDEKFPDNWSPNHLETLSDTVAECKEIRKLVQVFGSVHEKNRHRLWFSFRKVLEALIHKAETAQNPDILDTGL